MMMAGESFLSKTTLKKTAAATGKAQSRMLRDLVRDCLEDDKAQEIVILDLSGKTAMADYMIVASGGSKRHVGAMADHLLKRLKESGATSAQAEGLPHCDWVLIDAGDVIAHLFRPEVRAFYNLEAMWAADLPAESRPPAAPGTPLDPRREGGV